MSAPSTPLSLNDVPWDALWRFLPTPSLLQLAALSRQLRGRSRDKWLLEAIFRRDFGEPAPPDATPAAWGARAAAFYPPAPRSALRALAARGVLPRAQRVWATLRAFSAAHALPCALLPPAAASATLEAEAALGVRFPHALRALLACSEGQAHQGFGDAGADDFRGLLGGACIYDVQTTTALLPGGLGALRGLTELLRARVPGFPRELVPVARSSAIFFLLDCGEGSARGSLWRCGARALLAPAALGASIAPAGGGEGALEDCVLEWLEEYVARLARGVYTVESVEQDEDDPEGGANSDEARAARRYISAWPAASEGGGSHAVTHGIHVEVSSLLLPFQSILPGAWTCTLGAYGADALAAWRRLRAGSPQPPTEGDAPILSFGYRLRMWREAAAPSAHAGEYGAVRLTRRTWVSQEAGGEEERMGGPGVIGLFPQLRRGGRAFSYASQTRFEALPGRMRGVLHFKSEGWGSGEEFAVEVGEWVMGEQRVCLGPFLFF